jgi:serine/threonine-protein kinase
MKPPDSAGDTDDELDELVRAVAFAPPREPAYRSDLAKGRLGSVLRGKYRLDAVLGIGGMAVVYKATHRNQAEYAIKMLLPEHSMVEEIRSRFLREGYAANSVKHPGAVRVVDDDVSDDGAAFLVLELLHGLACDRMCAERGGRLPIEVACAIGVQVLEVLEAAHAKGIIHRDIKPANLFVVRDGWVKVLDFGIARVRETVATGSHTTGGGMLLGTPAFMAPEQALGKSGEIDLRADIWAVGATLFSLVSGLTVHEGDTGRELLVKLMTQPARSLASVVPEAPAAISAVVDRALSADRDRRWPSARAMRDALELAARQTWGELPSRSELAAMVAPLIPPSTVVVEPEVGKPTRQWGEPIVDPTMPVRERPGTPPGVAHRAVETSTPVLSERHSMPRARAPIAISGVLLTVSAALAAAVFIYRSRLAPRDLSAKSPIGAAGAVVEPSAPPMVSGAPVEAPAQPAASGARPVPLAGTPGPNTKDTSDKKLAMSLAAEASRPKRPARDAGASASSPPVGSTEARPIESAPPPKSAPPDCNPPFYYDSSYNRVFKKECL